MVLFLYNPFPAAQVRAVIDAVRARPARLVYVAPAHRAEVLEVGWRTVARGGEGPWRWEIDAP